MDLALLDTTKKAEEGVRMELRHPVTNDQLGVFLTVRGTDSKLVKAALLKYRRVLDDDRKSESEKERLGIEFIVKCILDIEGAEFEGKPILATDEGKRFLAERFPWAATQVFEFIQELEHFLPSDDSL
jgi:hypothetical protein